MIYDDHIYGRVEIQEPVILDLINSPAMQRLKGINQAGYFHVYFPSIPRSRFDHSLGVYFLLKKYGASHEEQISGLVHDLSHGTFSHCLDYIFEEEDQREQNHQDNIFESFINKTDIPGILSKHGLNINDIIDDKKFPLKETILPDLCADRIDYALRDAWSYTICSSEDISYILKHLIVKDKKRVFIDIASAKLFAELFYKVNEYMTCIESAAMLQAVGDCLKYAWQQGYLNADDFYTTDTQVLEKITAHIESDKQLSMHWQRMNNKIPYKNDPNDFDHHIFCKSRIIDPLFMDGDILRRISEVDNEWKTIVQIKMSPREYFLKFEK